MWQEATTKIKCGTEGIGEDSSKREPDSKGYGANYIQIELSQYSVGEM